MRRIFLFSLCISLSLTLAAQSTQHGSARIIESYGKLPLAFEANQGQTDPQVKFLSRGAGYSLFLTPTEAVLTLSAGSQAHVGRAFLPADIPETGAVAPKARLTRGAKVPALHAAKARISPAQKTAVLRMKLVGANAKAEVIGLDELPGKSNYFIGNDPKKCHTNVRQYAKVRYANVYPGVDLVYYGHQRELEYDFVLQPGADPETIRLGIEGANRLQLEHGDLVLTSAGGDVRLRSPRIYQEANRARQEVRGRYVITSKNEVRFRIGPYDRRRTLVIDPVLAYSTYLGGSNDDAGYGIAVDATGNAYVGGSTSSLNFPTANAIQTSRHGYLDAFVAKINADGNALVYSTYLGGSNSDWGLGIAVDAGGKAYVTGYTRSTDFPTLNAIQPTNHGYENAFVTKINATGALVYSTYLGGSASDGAWGIAVDGAGNAYVTGTTYSHDFPTVNPIQGTLQASADAFVTKISADGRRFVYSTYLGGTGPVGGPGTEGYGIAADAAGNAYVTGFTETADFPTFNAIQPTNRGYRNAFVSKLAASGTSFVYSTYLGGSYDDRGYAIAADAAGNAYVTGDAISTDFPTVNAIQPNNHGAPEAFVSKVNTSGSALVYSTYLGGSDYDSASSIAVDAAGNAYVTGGTCSTDLPIVNALQSTMNGCEDGFVTELNAEGSAFVYSTYLGGKASEVPLGITVDALGSAYVTGETESRDFPKTLLAFQPWLKGKSDVFVTKIAAQTLTSVSAPKLAFTVQVMGTVSATKKLTFTNESSSDLTIHKIFLGGPNPGDFAETNDCGLALAAGASCTISVTFIPTAKGTRKASLGVSSSDAASPQAIALTGSGTVVSLSKTKLSFGNQPVGTPSAPQSVTLTNVGSTQLNFTSITITGTNAGDFSQSNTCGTSIAAGANCTLTVTFTPAVTGARRAAVSISDDGGASPQKVTLTGTGQ